jgi:hypothetical protein
VAVAELVPEVPVPECGAVAALEQFVACSRAEQLEV